MHYYGILFAFADESIEDILAPYDEQTTNPDYLTFEDHTDEVKEEWEKLPQTAPYEPFRNYPKADKDEYPTPYEYAIDWYGYLSDEVENDEGTDNELRFGRLLNENAHYDWFMVGGRWSCHLIDKDGERHDKLHFDKVDWDAVDKPYFMVDLKRNWIDQVDEERWREELAKIEDAPLREGIVAYVIDAHI